MSYTITPLLSITEIDYKIIQLKTKPLAISKVRGKYESLEMGEKSSEFVWEKWHKSCYLTVYDSMKEWRSSKIMTDMEKRKS